MNDGRDAEQRSSERPTRPITPLPPVEELKGRPPTPEEAEQQKQMLERISREGLKVTPARSRKMTKEENEARVRRLRARNQVADDSELQAIHTRGSGFVFNPFYRKLHAAECLWVSRMTTGTCKEFYETVHEVVQNLGTSFESCPLCLPPDRIVDVHGPVK